MIFRKRERGEGYFTNESAQSLMKNNNSLNDDICIAQNKVKMNKNDEEDGNESDHNQTTFDLSSMHEPIKGTGIISLLGQPNLMPGPNQFHLAVSRISSRGEPRLIPR